VSFEVEPLRAFDGVPEYFLVTFEPIAIGAIPGIIIGQNYRFCYLSRMGSNPYEDNNIERENRYFDFPESYATIKDGVLVNIFNAHHIFEKDYIESRMQYLRSVKGRRFIKNFSSSL